MQYQILKDEIIIILNTNGVDINDVYIKCIKKLSKDFGIPDESKLKIKFGSSTKTIAGKHSIFVK